MNFRWLIDWLIDLMARIPQQGLNPGRGGLQEEKNRQSYSERYKKNLFPVW